VITGSYLKDTEVSLISLKELRDTLPLQILELSTAPPPGSGYKLSHLLIFFPIEFSFEPAKSKTPSKRNRAFPRFRADFVLIDRLPTEAIVADTDFGFLSAAQLKLLISQARFTTKDVRK
jgi:hypothetical protein